MNIIDSSGWLEYFSDGPNAKYYLPPLNDTSSDQSSLIVPVITIYEGFKVVLRETAENEALQAVAAMQKENVVELTSNIALIAAKPTDTLSRQIETDAPRRAPHLLVLCFIDNSSQ